MIQVILVRPIYPRNIGMVARSMANFAAGKLILIEPQCELNIEAREGAARAQEPLSQVQVYQNWQEFYKEEPEGLRLAFTRRSGKRRESESFSNFVQQQKELLSSYQNNFIYLIFGPEDHGLSDADLEFVHRIVHFDLPGKVKSMNLSHAVVTSLCILNESLAYQPNKDSAVKENFYFPDQALKNWLEALRYDLTTHARVNVYTILKRLILKAAPNPKELRLLESALRQTARKLKEKTPEEFSQTPLDS